MARPITAFQKPITFQGSMSAKQQDFVAQVFYQGSLSTWSRKVDPREVIFECAGPWLWLVRKRAIQQLGNTGRCSYVITQGDKVIEKLDAPAPAFGVLEEEAAGT